MSLEIRAFDIREADWKSDQSTLSNLRRLVFIVEQSVPQEEEWDGQDEDAWHWLATDPDHHPIGTARLLPSGQIGRMAVLAEHRGLKIGAAMLEAAVQKARQLGFQSVFLNAQSHALGFYEKAGFSAVGDEFMEAGIAHYRMEQALSPLDDHVQRKYLSSTPSASGGGATGIAEASIQDFDTAEIPWSVGRKLIRSLRKSVLQVELGLAENLIEGPEDSNAVHFQTQSNNQTVGAIRMSLEGELSHLVVDSNFRRRGIGQALIAAATVRAQRYGLEQLKIRASAELNGFFTGCGFSKSEKGFEKHLSAVDLSTPERESRQGTAYDSESQPYRLGESAGLLLLRRESEFHRVILTMTQQASQSIRILSPMLDHKLFDSTELYETCSALARKNKYTRIEFLLYDTHRVVKNGHALVEIARRLPSSIGIKVVHPELRSLNHEFVLVDDAGLIYRQDIENYEGYANFKDVTESNRLKRQFRAAWESGLQDPNLRQIKI